MSTAPTINIPGTYAPEQTQVLLRLLAEYTGKLTTECDKRESTIQRRNNIRLNIALFFAVLIIGIFILEAISLNSIDTKHTPSFIVKYDFITPFVALVMACCYVGLSVFTSYTEIKYRQRDVFQITFTANQLERLVRRISPIAEYANIGLGEKLELDLRLADADTALENAAHYVGKRGKSGNGTSFEKHYEANLHK